MSIQNQKLDQATPQLVGSSNEVTVEIHHKSIKALLDTGSTVSTISESFYNEHLSDITLQPLNCIINIECANGIDLPYKGFIEVDVTFIDLHSTESKILACMLLVVPDNAYSRNVPLLLGTNVLSELVTQCEKDFGKTFARFRSSPAG